METPSLLGKHSKNQDQTGASNIESDASNIESDKPKVRKKQKSSLGRRSLSISSNEIHKKIKLTESTDQDDIQSNPLAEMITAIITEKPFAPNSRTIFLTLIKEGRTPAEVTCIKELIASNKTLVETDAQASPISLAAKNSFDPIFQIVWENHTQTPQNFNTDEALFNACISGSNLQKATRCTQLLGKGWKFDRAQSKYKTTLIHLIYAEVDFSYILECFSHLININGLLSNNTPFFAALLETKNIKMLQYVMDSKELKFDPEARYSNEIYGHKSSNMTYLADACRLGLFDIALKLLRLRPNFATIKSEVVGTPLHAISFLHLHDDKLNVEDYTQIILCCINKGANANEIASIICYEWNSTFGQRMPAHLNLTPIQTAIFYVNLHCTQAFLELENEKNVKVITDDEHKKSLQELANSSMLESNRENPKAKKIFELLSNHAVT